MTHSTKLKAYAVTRKGLIYLPSIATSRRKSWQQITKYVEKDAWIKDGYKCKAITIEVTK